MGVLAEMHWDTQSSGIEIPEPVARAVERKWATVTARTRLASPSSIAISAVEGTLTEAKRYIRKRDRQLRNLAIAESKGFCTACGTAFGRVLDGDGRAVLHHGLRARSARVNRMSIGAEAAND
jgi:5-methylcytosine-specific restriction protein A